MGGGGEGGLIGVCKVKKNRTLKPGTDRVHQVYWIVQVLLNFPDPTGHWIKQVFGLKKADIM